MLRLLTVHACRDCPQNAALFAAADEAGESVTLEPVLRDTEETRQAAAFGLGLPVLVALDGAMSVDAVTWLGREEVAAPEEAAPVAKGKAKK